MSGLSAGAASSSPSKLGVGRGESISLFMEMFRSLLSHVRCPGALSWNPTACLVSCLMPPSEASSLASFEAEEKSVPPDAPSGLESRGIF